MITRFSTPLQELLGIQKALEEARAADWFGPAATTSRGAFPPVNVFQDNDNYVIITEIPGAKREDLDIQVQKNHVRLSGKKVINYGENASIHRSERDSGRFDRTISIPFDVDAEGVKAEYRDGILALFIPRAEHEKPRTVNIG
jgi:HSP20 family protein